jgi:hypothetical protein
MGRLRDVGHRAVAQLQEVAKEMSHTDAPMQEHDSGGMPRFELRTLPASLSLGHWKLWGQRILRSHINTRLRESIGSHLKEELHHFGIALSQWSEMERAGCPEAGTAGQFLC